MRIWLYYKFKKQIKSLILSWVCDFTKMEDIYYFAMHLIAGNINPRNFSAAELI